MCKKQAANPEWKPEPFPEPRTIPDKWEASALDDLRKNAAGKMSSPDEWKPEPFPEPRGLPWRKD